MIRRLNYTNRQKIERKDVAVFLKKSSGLSSFNAELRLERYKLPANAMVFVEAYRLTTRMRFSFGTVGNVSAEGGTLLSNFDTADGILFRIKVTEAGAEHILLAEADRVPLINPEDKDSSRQGLLPIMPGDIGDEIWRLAFESSGPMLIMNRKVDKGYARSNVFVSLVFPTIIRQVLSHILFIEEHFDAEDEESWMSRWLKFAKTFSDVEVPADKQDFEDWIDSVAAKFALRVQAYDRFLEFENKDSI